MREVSDDEAVPRDGLGVVPTSFVTQGPKTVPRVDYERIFILDEQARLLAEYALRDDCPLEFEDLGRSIPVGGMRHLVSFFQGEYVFTPFRVENLWFVVLTRGVPRIQERGSIGTLLAAMRAHLPASLAPALAEKEAILRERERELDRRESLVAFREERVLVLEADVQIAGTKMRELETDIRAREMRLDALRDYAVRLQQTFREADKPPVPNAPEENPPAPNVSSPPP